MTIGYVLFAMVWGVIVALTQPPLMVGALLVAIPIIFIGLILRGTSKAVGARRSFVDERH
jgi:hypothetical protein